MSYTPSYEKPYPEGFKNEPIETTPITAEVMNGYDDAIENIENYLAEGEMGTVVIANPEIEGTEPNLTALQVGEDKFKIPSGSGGASSAEDVSYDNSVTEIEATNVQDAIDSVFISVSNGKTLIADAITDKGVETSATDTFAIMAEHIAEIEGGGSGIDISLNANWYTNLSDSVDSNFQKFRLSSETVHLVEYDSNTRELVILEDSIAMFSFENDHASNNIAEMNIYINGISTETFNIPLNSYVFRLYKFSVGDRIKVYKGSGGWSCIASCFIKKT